VDIARQRRDDDLDRAHERLPQEACQPHNVTARVELVRWLDSHGVRRKPVSDGFTPGSRYVTFFDPDGIPLEFYYMDAAYAEVYGVDIEPQ
jgi:hypothetical protein